MKIDTTRASPTQDSRAETRRLAAPSNCCGFSLLALLEARRSRCSPRPPSPTVLVVPVVVTPILLLHRRLMFDTPSVSQDNTHRQVPRTSGTDPVEDRCNTRKSRSRLSSETQRLAVRPPKPMQARWGEGCEVEGES